MIMRQLVFRDIRPVEIDVLGVVCGLRRLDLFKKIDPILSEVTRNVLLTGNYKALAKVIPLIKACGQTKLVHI